MATLLPGHRGAHRRTAADTARCSAAPVAAAAEPRPGLLKNIWRGLFGDAPAAAPPAVPAETPECGTTRSAWWRT